jgi:DnaJ like chaperone protein
MGFLGKLVGGTIGFAMGGPLGAVAGAVFGHAFDRNSGDDIGFENEYIAGNQVQDQLTFFVAAFSMLAKLARSDGQITQEEINSIERFMAEDLSLDPQSRKVARDIFHAATNRPESFQDYAVQFYNQFREKPRLLEMMIDIMIRVSLADGKFSPSEEALISSAVKIFQMSDGSYQKLKARYVNDTEKYYAALGCSTNDSEEHIKRQYRKLVLEYHPDKIASKGLPEAFTHFANEKFREIQEAYEKIKAEQHIK